MSRYRQDVEAIREEMIAWRRYLHQNPELSFQEYRTSAWIMERLREFGIEDVRLVAGTGVVARLIGSEPGGCVALRADIDALPIQEENDVPYRSRNPGVMHACGHDGHTAMLLGAAKILAARRKPMRGEVRLIFQKAEEVFPGGARDMIEEGVLEGVDAIIGTHLWSPMAAGTVGVASGPVMAAPDRFRIEIIGRGGHGGAPQDTVDPILVGSQVVGALQSVVNRRTDPLDQLVISVCEFHAGTAHNIIPNQATLVGTVRTFREDVRRRVSEQMESIVKGICAAFGATYTFEYERGYAPVVNDERVARLVREAAEEVVGPKRVETMAPVMGGEDFSAYLQVVPGCFFFTGAGNPAKGARYPHHHPKFAIDEDVLPIGVEIFLTALDKLSESFHRRDGTR